jgi:hypothetical protein
MISVTGSVIINSRIWRREPFLETLSRLITCRCVSPLYTREIGLEEDERVISPR